MSSSSFRPRRHNSVKPALHTTDNDSSPSEYNPTANDDNDGDELSTSTDSTDDSPSDYTDSESEDYTTICPTIARVFAPHQNNDKNVDVPQEPTNSPDSADNAHANTLDDDNACLIYTALGYE